MEIKAEDIIGWRDGHGNSYWYGDLDKIDPTELMESTELIELTLRLTEDDYRNFKGLVKCD